jgi:hypothetical protein
VKISTVDTVFSLTLGLLYMLFACTFPCNHSFASRGGLNRHHNRCPIYRTSQELKLQQRRVAAVEGQKETLGAYGALDTRKAHINNLIVGVFVTRTRGY